MNLTFAEYLKLKNMEPGSEDAVHMGCTCLQEKEDNATNSDQKVITIDPYCPFHWYVALQAQFTEMLNKARDTEKFNSALKFGYFVLGAGMIAALIFKA